MNERQRWEERHDRAATRSVPSEFVERHARRVAEARPGCRALDLACGTGRHSRLLAELGFHVVALDFARAALARARSEGRRIRPVQADASALPVVNHRGPEFHAAYEEIQRLARPLFGTKGEILVMAASGTGAMEAALVNAKRSTAEVGFLCVHQGTPWLRQVVQDYLGLSHARTVETFARVGYLFSAILPAGLAFARDEALLHDGDVVVMTGGGTGMSYGALVLRWGGR